MKRNILSLLLTTALIASVTAGCSTAVPADTTVSDTAAVATEETSSEESESSEETEETDAPVIDDVTIRVGSLNGPTTVGILSLMNDVENGEAIGNYEFTELTQPDELVASLNAGDVDIALIPANMASILYNRTESISVIDINTLGVIECISADDSITSVSDLAGKTVYSVGQGATPEYALNYLLDSYGIEDCTIEFKAEPAEVIAELTADPEAVGFLPEPAATAQAAANGLNVCFALTDEWENATDDSILITGVTVVSNDFLAEHPDAVAQFLEAHAASVDAANATGSDEVAALAVDHGFFANADMASVVIPRCNTVCITGDEMKTLLSGYLQTLFDQNPDAVGGQMPADEFYYVG